MRLSALSLLVLVAAGCSRGPLVTDAPTPVTAVGYPSHTRQQIVAAVAAAVAPVRSVAADGDVQIASDRLDQDASFSLRARLTGRPSDSLTVVVRGPFGIEGGRGVVTRDSVLAADRINRVLYVGPASAADRYVPGGSSPEAAARVVLGLLVPEAAVAWEVRPENNRYTLRGRLAGGTTREYTVDPGLWRVVAVREYDAAGALRGQQDVSEFDTVDGVPMPRRVHVSGAGVDVTFEHRRLAVNPADLRLTFNRPDYRVVRLR
ncbi:MAG TPA: DUF4292 domain-containing protein [Rubricoccaceae bacterium]|jgi:hypothetical protein